MTSDAVGSPSYPPAVEDPATSFQNYYQRHASGQRMQRAGIDWSGALPAIAAGGLVCGLSLFLPFGLFGIGLFASGYTAVSLYRRRRPRAPLTQAIGAGLGAASGTLGFVVWAAMAAVGIAIKDSWNQVQEAVFHSIDEAAARNPDPKMQEMASQLKTPEGLIVMVIAALLITLLVFLIICTVSGLMAARIQLAKDRSQR